MGKIQKEKKYNLKDKESKTGQELDLLNKYTPKDGKEELKESSDFNSLGESNREKNVSKAK